MRLHENKQLFADAINAASRPKNEGGLGIKRHQSFESIRHRG